MNAADRKNRATEIIAHEAARFIASEAAPESLITVVRAEPASKNGDRVIVFVSVFPESKTRPALAFLERHRAAFSDHLKARTRLRPLPRVDFLPDNRAQAI